MAESYNLYEKLAQIYIGQKYSIKLSSFKRNISINGIRKSKYLIFHNNKQKTTLRMLRSNATYNSLLLSKKNVLPASLKLIPTRRTHVLSDLTYIQLYNILYKILIVL